MAQEKPERTPEEEESIKKKFEMFLTEEIDPEKLRLYEIEYYKGSDNETDMEMQHYNYAEALIRSRYTINIMRGITLMEGISDVIPEEKVRSWFMMSLGYARLRQYNKAIIFLNVFRKRVKLIGTMEIIDWGLYLEAKKKQQEEELRAKKVADILQTTSVVVLISALVGLSYVALKQ